MKRSVVQNALLLLTAGLIVPALTTHAADNDRVAVIRIMAIDGVLVDGAPVTVTRDQAFLTGAGVRVSHAALSSLDGIHALVLIDRRSDALNGSEMVQSHKEEVLAVTGDSFTVKGLGGKDVTYALDQLSDGSVDLLGPADQIIARSKGEYKIWKVEDVSMVPRDRIALY